MWALAHGKMFVRLGRIYGSYLLFYRNPGRFQGFRQAMILPQNQRRSKAHVLYQCLKGSRSHGFHLENTRTAVLVLSLVEQKEQS